MSLPIEAIREGYEELGLGGGDHIYLGERPQAVTGNCTVLTLDGGIANGNLPVERLHVQVTIYHTAQYDAHDRAWAAYQTLSQQVEWILDDWQVMGVVATEPPRSLPAISAQGGILYRAVFSVDFIMKRMS